MFGREKKIITIDKETLKEKPKKEKKEKFPKAKLTKAQKEVMKAKKNEEKRMIKLENIEKNNIRKEINKFNFEWIETMAYLDMYNQLSQVFALRDIQKENYGFQANIYAPKGLTVTEFENEKNVAKIQSALKCLFVGEAVPKSNMMKAKFITKDVGFADYKPIKLKPYEILLSQAIDGTPMVANMLKYPHLLVQGSTNMGKSKFIDIILTNLVTTLEPSEVGFYILQADKNDQYAYSGCKHCKGYSNELLNSVAMLQELLKIVEDRNNSLLEYNYNGVCNNIKEYNDAISDGTLKNRAKWEYLYLVIDEYASLMPDSGSGNDKETKKVIQAYMERIVQIGRSVGLYVILSTQRGTVDKLPSFIKAMCCSIVSFKVNNRKSSEVALDTGEAVNLKQREFITKIESMQFGQTYNLTQPQIIEYIKPFRYAIPPKFKFKLEDDGLIDKDGGKKTKRKTKAERKKEKKALEEILDEASKKENQELEKVKEKFLNKKEVEEVNKIVLKEKKEKIKMI